MSEGPEEGGVLALPSAEELRVLDTGKDHEQSYKFREYSPGHDYLRNISREDEDV